MTPKEAAEKLTSDMFDLATYPVSPEQGEQVAKLAAHVAARLFADELHKLSHYWANDVISPQDYWENVAHELL